MGFVTNDGKQFSLDIDPAAKFSIQDITEHQGEQLKLTGVVNEKELIGFQTLRDGRFIVSKFKTTGKGSPKRTETCKSPPFPGGGFFLPAPAFSLNFSPKKLRATI